MARSGLQRVCNASYTCQEAAHPLTRGVGMLLRPLDALLVSLVRLVVPERTLCFRSFYFRRWDSNTEVTLENDVGVV